MPSIGVIASKTAGGGGRPEGVPDDALKLDLGPQFFSPINSFGSISENDGIWEAFSATGNARLNLRSFGNWVLNNNIDPISFWFQIEYTSTPSPNPIQAFNVAVNKFIPFIPPIYLIPSQTLTVLNNAIDTRVLSGSSAELVGNEFISLFAGGNNANIIKVRILSAFYL